MNTVTSEVDRIAFMSPGRQLQVQLLSLYQLIQPTFPHFSWSCGSAEHDTKRTRTRKYFRIQCNTEHQSSSL